jgi:hypothetical protein
VWGHRRASWFTAAGGLATEAGAGWARFAAGAGLVDEAVVTAAAGALSAGASLGGAAEVDGARALLEVLAADPLAGGEFAAGVWADPTGAVARLWREVFGVPAGWTPTAAQLAELAQAARLARAEGRLGLAGLFGQARSIRVRAVEEMLGGLLDPFGALEESQPERADALRRRMDVLRGRLAAVGAVDGALGAAAHHQALLEVAEVGEQLRECVGLAAAMAGGQQVLPRPVTHPGFVVRDLAGMLHAHGELTSAASLDALIASVAPGWSLPVGEVAAVLALARAALIPPEAPRARLGLGQFCGFARLAVIAARSHPQPTAPAAIGRLAADVLGLPSGATATPQQLAALAAVAAGLPAARLGRDALAEAWPAAQITPRPKPARVTEHVPGLYRSIDPDLWPPGWHFDEGIEPADDDGVVRVATIVKASPGGPDGIVKVSYQPGGGMLSPDQAFLDRLPNRWVATDPPMVPGRGTPLHTYLRLRAMRQLGVRLADLQTVRLHEVLHTSTVLELAHAKRDGAPLEEAARRSQLVLLAENAIVQSGGRITGVRVYVGRWYGGFTQFADEELAEFGLDGYDLVPTEIDIVIDVQPGVEVDAGVYHPGKNDTPDHVAAAKSLPKLDKFTVVVGQGVDGGLELADGRVLPPWRIAEQLAGKNVVLAACGGNQLAADLVRHGVAAVLATDGLVWFAGGKVLARQAGMDAQGRMLPGMSDAPARWVLTRPGQVDGDEPARQELASGDLLEVLHNELPEGLREAGPVRLDPRYQPARPVHFGGGAGWYLPSLWHSSG